MAIVVINTKKDNVYDEATGDWLNPPKAYVDAELKKVIEQLKKSTIVKTDTLQVLCCEVAMHRPSPVNPIPDNPDHPIYQVNKPGAPAYGVIRHEPNGCWKVSGNYFFCDNCWVKTVCPEPNKRWSESYEGPKN